MTVQDDSFNMVRMAETPRKGPTGTACLAVALALFAIGVVVHVLLGDFPKAIDVLPDERRYLEIARSLFSGNGLIMRGAPSDFQKILYPLSLFPALFFSDGQTQIRVINVLNSVYACSAVFPALLIARKVFRNNWAVMASLVFTALIPDTMYSLTFMSESLYLPIALWMVYLCWTSFESRGKAQLALSAMAGLLGYATYLCKEVAWMFPIAFAAWHIMAAIVKRQTPRRSLACMALFAGGFFIPFVIMKLTLFAGLFNSYGQFSFDILLSPYTVLFGIYSLFTDGTYFIVCFGVFPVIYLACTFREMDRSNRDLLFFCLVSLLIGLAVVVFTISMREDVGHVALRQHLRYVAPLSLPLLMLFMRQVSRLDVSKVTSSPGKFAALVGTTVGFCVLVATMFGSGNLSQGFDYAEFHFMRWFMKELSAPLAQEFYDGWNQTISAIDTTDGDLLVIEPLVWASRAAIIAFTATGMALLLSRNKKVRLRGGGAICAVIGALMVANAAAMVHYDRNAYDVEQADIDEICTISEQLEVLGAGSDVIVVLDKANTGPNNLIDTYLQDGAGDYEYLQVDKLRAGMLDNADFILTNTNQHVDLDGLDVVKIGGSNSEKARFELYQVTGRSEPALDFTFKPDLGL